MVRIDTLLDINGQDSLVYTVYDTTYTRAIEKSDTIYHDIYYKFEGYQIYQLADANVGAAELTDPSKALHRKRFLWSRKKL